uniref:Uncharacterized protein n=2 Tax=Meloidogyne TaxID=189290 RepID=A0A6V7U4W5_MELEN|nr:unnamed protein product [Meloidogyne enterolobii]
MDANLVQLRNETSQHVQRLVIIFDSMSGGQIVFVLARIKFFNGNFDSMYRQFKKLPDILGSKAGEINNALALHENLWQMPHVHWMDFEETENLSMMEEDLRPRFKRKRRVLFQLFTFLLGIINDLEDVVELIELRGFAKGCLGTMEPVFAFYSNRDNRIKNKVPVPDVDNTDVVLERAVKNKE